MGKQVFGTFSFFCQSVPDWNAQRFPFLFFWADNIKKKKKELFLFLEREKKSRGYRVPVHGQDRQRHVTEWRIASSTGCPIDREYFLFIFVCVAILLKAKQKFIKSFLLIFPLKMKSLPVIRFGRGQQRMWYSCAIESRKRNKIPRISKCFVSFSNVSGFFTKIHPWKRKKGESNKKSRSLRERQKRLEKKIISFLDPSSTKRFQVLQKKTNNLWYFLSSISDTNDRKPEGTHRSDVDWSSPMQNHFRTFVAWSMESILIVRSFDSSATDRVHPSQVCFSICLNDWLVWTIIWF